jgi:hypothetical protein
VERDLYLRTFTHYNAGASLLEHEEIAGGSGDMAAPHSRTVVAGALQSNDARRTARLIKYRTRPTELPPPPLRDDGSSSSYTHTHITNNTNTDATIRRRNNNDGVYDASLWHDEQQAARERGYGSYASRQSTVMHEHDLIHGRPATHVGPRDLYSIGIHAQYVPAVTH